MRKNKRLSWLLAMVFLFTTMLGAVPSQAVAADLSDIGNHWAQSQIKALVDKGVVTGYPDNTFQPDKTITRAEFITMTNKAYSFTATAAINYKDVPASEWYAPEIAKAKAAGYIDGYEDGTMRPNALISRQEAAKIISVIKKLDSSSDAALSVFTDARSIPAWSRGYVAAMVTAKLINGYPDGTFKAANAINRAEAAVILGRTIGIADVIPTLYDKAGTFGPASGTQTIDGDVVISADGVNLQNTIIKGNLIIDAAVAEGSVNLKNVTVTGTTTIKGGGTGTKGVTFENSTLKDVNVDKTAGPVKVSFLSSSSVSKLTLNSAATVAGSGVSQAVINSNGVVLESAPGSYTVKSGVTATIADKTVTGTFGGGGGGGGGTGSTAQQVAPVIIADGALDDETLAKLTTLSTTTTGADIYYTIDGSTPTSASDLYVAPFYLNVGTTIKAVAIKSGMTDSAVASATYSNASISANKTYGPALGSGTGTVTVLGNVSLSGSGATTTVLQNMIINGDLTIDVGDAGDVELNNVTVNGTTDIKSAAPSSVRATGTTYLVNVSVTSTTTVRIVAEDNSVISNLTVSTSQAVELVANENGEISNTTIASSSNVTVNTDGTGTFSNVNVQSAASQTVNVSGNINNIALTGTVAATLNIAAGSTVSNVSSATTAASTLNLSGATVSTVQAQTSTTITGTGTIGTLTATATVQATTTVVAEITVTRIIVSAPADADEIAVANPKGANDTVTVIGLNAGEVVTVYRSATGAAIGNATATGADGQATAVVSGLDLGKEKGSVWVSVITPGAIESVKVQKSFAAEPIANRPTANPGAGWIAPGQRITLTAEAGAEIRYTIDGTTPTTASTLYSAPIAIDSQTDLKAIAIVAGKNDSPVLNANYKIMGTVVTPIATPAASTVKAGTLVSLACATAGATIYYTTDGSEPNDRSLVYSEPIPVNAAMTIKARAVKQDMVPSAVMSAAYALMQTCVKPVASPAAGPVDAGTQVELTTTTAGADIYYTVDGSTPTKSSTKYTAKIAIDATKTIKAIAVKDGYINSAVLSATYTIKGEVAPPVANPEAGYVAAGTTVALTTTTDGATIHYTTDGSAPSSASTAYTTAIAINATQTIKAIAIKDGMTNSAVISATYTVIAEQAAPTGLTGVAPTSATKNDGKITGTTDAMEYKLSTATETAYIPATATEITGLAAGTYNVRYAAKDGFNAGTKVDVTVPAYVALPVPSAPTGLQGVAPTSAANNDGKITGTTNLMEYKLSTAANFSDASATETTGLAAGTYYVRIKAKTGYAPGAIAQVVVPAFKNKDQAAPTGLSGEAPTLYGGNDGKITGTTTAMEYKLVTGANYTAASATSINGLAAGTYYVRFAAKAGFNAGATATVVVPQGAPAAPQSSEVTIAKPAADTGVNQTKITIAATLEFRITDSTGATVKQAWTPGTGAALITTASPTLVAGDKIEVRVKAVSPVPAGAVYTYTVKTADIGVGTPSAPQASDVTITKPAVNVGIGQTQITIANVLEFSITSAAGTEKQAWTQGTGAALMTTASSALVAGDNIKVRVKAAGENPAGNIYTYTLKADDIGVNSIISGVEAATNVGKVKFKTNAVVTAGDLAGKVKATANSTTVELTNFQKPSKGTEGIDWSAEIPTPLYDTTYTLSAVAPFTIEGTTTVSWASVKVTGITVSGAGGANTIESYGGTLQMQADVQPGDATNKTVTWSITSGTEAATINATTGLLTAKENGSVIVRATANDGSNKYGEATIVITGNDGFIDTSVVKSYKTSAMVGTVSCRVMLKSGLSTDDYTAYAVVNDDSETSKTDMVADATKTYFLATQLLGGSDVTTDKVVVTVIRKSDSVSQNLELPFTQQTAKLAANAVTVTNNAGATDTVTITGLTAGDLIKVYDASSGGNLLGQATATGTSVTVSNLDLGLAAGTVYVSRTRVDWLESNRTGKTYDQDQAAPVGLAGVAPSTEANTDGRITGVTTAMEYKISTATDYTAVTGSTITSLVPGTYQVRYAAKTGYIAGETADVIVPAYTPPDFLDKSVVKSYKTSAMVGTVSCRVMLKSGLSTDDYTAYAVVNDDSETSKTDMVADATKTYFLATQLLGGSDVTTDKVVVTVIRKSDSVSQNLELPFTQQTAKLAANAVTVTNNAGATDTVTITGLTAGDLIKVYDASSGGNLLGQATATGTSVTVSNLDLGLAAGTVYVSRTRVDWLESNRTGKTFPAE